MSWLVWVLIAIVLLLFGLAMLYWGFTYEKPPLEVYSSGAGRGAVYSSGAGRGAVYDAEDIFGEDVTKFIKYRNKINQMKRLTGANQTYMQEAARQILDLYPDYSKASEDPTIPITVPEEDDAYDVLYQDPELAENILSWMRHGKPSDIGIDRHYVKICDPLRPA